MNNILEGAGGCGRRVIGTLLAQYRWDFSTVVYDGFIL